MITSKFPPPVPRFAAYTNSAHGYKLIAETDDEPRAWALAEAVAQAANATHTYRTWVEVWDREANDGRGSFSSLLDAA